MIAEFRFALSDWSPNAVCGARAGLTWPASAASQWSPLSGLPLAGLEKPFGLIKICENFENCSKLTPASDRTGFQVAKSFKFYKRVCWSLLQRLESSFQPNRQPGMRWMFSSERQPIAGRWWAQSPVVTGRESRASSNWPIRSQSEAINYGLAFYYIFPFAGLHIA